MKATSFRAILDSLPEHHVLLEPVRDPAGTIVDFRFAYANSAACAFNRLPQERLLGRRLLELHPAAAASGLLDHYRAVVESGPPVALDDWSYPQDLEGGEVRFYDVRMVPVEGAVSQMWRDVSARHRLVERLAESEEHYRLLAENAADVVVQGDREGLTVWVSPSVTAIEGWVPEELIGRPIAAFLHPHDRAPWQAAAVG